MFLSPVLPKITRRSRLENLLLLLLRCLVLLLLAMAFARPFLNRPEPPVPPANNSKEIVLLVDTSASMRRPGLWNDARNRLDQWLRKCSASDRVALFTFDRQARSLISFEEWSKANPSERIALVQQRLSSVAPTWFGTHLGVALNTAVESFDQIKSDPALLQREIIVITDLQEGSHLDGLQGYEWPHEITVRIDPLKLDPATNAGLQLLFENEELAAVATESGVRVQVQNSTDAKREQFQIGWGATALDARTDVYVPPGQSRIVPLPKPADASSAQQLRLAGDDLDFDNSVYLVPVASHEVKILYVGTESGEETAQPLYYLLRAFQQTRRQKVQVITRRPTDSISASDARGAAMLVIADAISSENAATLRTFLSEGKPALIVLKNPQSLESANQLGGFNSLAAEETKPTQYALFGEIDFQHPLFAPFADPRFSDFTKIHFWKYRRISGEDLSKGRVIARFDNGDPVLIQFTIGKGMLLVLCAGWQPSDSQLALSSKFVPLLYSVLEHGAGTRSLLTQYRVGDAVPLTSTNSSRTISLRKPDGSQKSWEENTPFSETDQPGIYSVVEDSPSRQFAVNLDPAESRTAQLPLDDLEKLGLPLHEEIKSASKNAEQKRRLLVATELEQQQKLWRWLIVAAFATLLIETFLAARPVIRAAT
jgi:hypothetical protein